MVGAPAAFSTCTTAPFPPGEENSRRQAESRTRVSRTQMAERESDSRAAPGSTSSAIAQLLLDHEEQLRLDFGAIARRLAHLLAHHRHQPPLLLLKLRHPEGEVHHR